MTTNHTNGLHSLTAATEMARDPVCKGSVEIEEAIDQETYEGNTYYFCSEECAEDFRSSPRDYLPTVAQA